MSGDQATQASNAGEAPIRMTRGDSQATIQGMEFGQYTAKIRCLEEGSTQRVALADEWPDHEARIQVGLGKAKDVVLNGDLLKVDFAENGATLSQEELAYMSHDQAAILVAEVFMKLFPKAMPISEDDTLEVEDDDGSWSGTVFTGIGVGWVFSWVIAKDEDRGDYLISFTDYDDDDLA